MSDRAWWTLSTHFDPMDTPEVSQQALRHYARELYAAGSDAVVDTLIEQGYLEAVKDSKLTLRWKAANTPLALNSLVLPASHPDIEGKKSAVKDASVALFFAALRFYRQVSSSRISPLHVPLLYCACVLRVRSPTDMPRHWLLNVAHALLYHARSLGVAEDTATYIFSTGELTASQLARVANAEALLHTMPESPFTEDNVESRLEEAEREPLRFLRESAAALSESAFASRLDTLGGLITQHCNQLLPSSAFLENLSEEEREKLVRRASRRFRHLKLGVHEAVSQVQTIQANMRQQLELLAKKPQQKAAPSPSPQSQQLQAPRSARSRHELRTPRTPSSPSSKLSQHDRLVAEHLNLRQLPVSMVNAAPTGMIATDDYENRLKALPDTDRYSHVWNELLKTESQYVQNLGMIEMAYVLPLTKRGILDESIVLGEHGTLFANVRELFKFNKEFMKALQQGEKDPGAVFLTFIEGFKKYATFVANTDTAKRLAKRLITQNKQFADFMEKAAVNVVQQGKRFDSILAAPLQRLVKYPLLLTELIKASPDAGTTAYTNMNQALRLMRETVVEVNNNVKFINREKALQALQTRLNHGKVQCMLEAPGRSWVLQKDECKVRKPKNSSSTSTMGSPVTYTVALFTDLILMMHRKNNTRLELKTILVLENITECRATTADERHARGGALELIIITRAESSKKRSRMYTLQMTDEDELATWEKKVNSKVKKYVACMERDKTMNEIRTKKQ